MELTQSSHLRVMFKGFTVVVEATRSFIGEIFAAWGEDVGKRGSSSEPERCVGIGHNLVPWHLSVLELVWNDRLKNIQTSYGTAHQLIGRRCVTITRYFFHAFLSILKTGLTEAQLSQDNSQALLKLRELVFAVATTVLS